MNLRLRCVWYEGLPWVVTAVDWRGLLTLERVENRERDGYQHQIRRFVRPAQVTPIGRGLAA